MRRVAAPLVALVLLSQATTAAAQEGGYHYDDGPDVVAPPAGAEAGRDGGPRKHRMRRVQEIEETRAPSTISAKDGFPLAGYHAGKIYLRDEDDHFRFYPGGLLQVDTRLGLGRGVDDVNGPLGEPTRGRVEIHRARLDLGGEVGGRWSFFLSGDLAHQQLEHALVDVEVHRWFHLSVGQQQTPFTMDNRTATPYRAWMDRPLTVRFAQPSEYDLGAMAWGESRRRFFSYEAGVFGGDGQNRPSPDNRVDMIGRAVLRPLAGTGGLAEGLHIGASGFWGMRRTSDISYDAPGLSTEGGYQFFTPNYLDGTGRLVHVIPSGVQRGWGGEVRVPVSMLDLRFEFVQTHRETREAIDGFQRTNTERFGTQRGTAFYAQLGVWVLGSPAVRPEPGRFRPPHVEFPKGHPHTLPRGMELFVRAEALKMTYAAGDRQKTDTDTTADRTVTADVIGGGINYYASRHAMLAMNYAYYIFPSSGSADNAALAPGNLGCSASTPGTAGLPCRTGAHSLHELAVRLQMYF